MRSEFTVSIYPNPRDENVNLAWSMIPDNNIEINVTDMMGRAIIKRKIFNSVTHTWTLNLNEYAGGVYFIIMRAGNQQQVTKYVK